MRKTIILMSIALLSCSSACTKGEGQAGGNKAPVEKSSDWWWPAQKSASSYIECTRPVGIEESAFAQSLSGLAARAVNEGRYDELVWLQDNRAMYGEWLQKTVKQNSMRKSGEKSVWKIAQKLKKEGVLKGYILYAKEDGGINVATVYAGVMEGALIEEALEDQARAIGLELLFDARGVTTQECFDANKDKLSRELVAVIRSDLPYNRDMAIAHKAMTYYGVDAQYEAILEWLNPISPILGWNEGPESEHIEPPSRYGHLNTVSDFSANFTFLSAGAKNYDIKKAVATDPKRIDFNKKGNYHAFVMSDGDNMQWDMDGLLNEEYMGHPVTNEIPINWTVAAVNLSQAAPAVWDGVVERQSKNASMVEFSGGYQYADVFASNRADRWNILREFARITGDNMNRVGVTVMNVMMRNAISSEDAQKAYLIYAEQIENLTGIVAIQYSPYHGGGGEVYWVKNKQGVEIPVVTARYSLWGKIASAGFGRPDQIAEWINEDAKKEKQQLAWTIVHAWSRYAKLPDGTIEDRDNADRNGKRGVEPVAWSVELLDGETTVVSIEELLWRIRMAHDPVQTRKIINQK